MSSAPFPARSNIFKLRGKIGLYTNVVKDNSKKGGCFQQIKFDQSVGLFYLLLF